MSTEKELTGYPSIDKPWLKYYSEEAINTPLPECTIYEYLWENNKDHLDDIALNYFDRKITFKELFNSIEKAAKAFTSIGVKQGDIVVMATITTPETIYAFYGLNRIGAIANMVDPRTSIEGIKQYIVEVNAEYILTIDVAYLKIEKAIKDTQIRQVIVVSPADSLPQPKKFLLNMSNRLKGTVQKLSDICLRWDAFVCNGENIQANYIQYQKDTCCVIVHTGGTTGTPKGVMLSNDNVNALVLQSILTGIDMKREHTWLDIMPPFIAYGIGMGYMSEDGSLFILGRLKRMIVRYDGFKIFPTLIENVLSSHTAIDACCSVGTIDKEHSQGKLPIVHIVLKPEYKQDEADIKQELISLCQKELPEYAQPIYYKFRESLPLTPIGKVDYRALEDEAKS